MLTNRRGLVVSTTFVAIGMTSVRTAHAADQVDVRIRLDQTALSAIPAPMRSSFDIKKDVSPEADAMIKAAPPEKAVPIILIVAGILAVPVLFRTVQEMFRQAYYGGILIDTRKIPIDITYSRTIPSNMVFVIDSSGSTKQYKADDFAETTLADLLKGRLK